MKMTKEELLMLFHVITKMQGEPKLKTKLVYALNKNMAAIKDEIEALKSISPEVKEGEYKQRRIALASEYSEKGEDSKPVIEDGNFKILEDIKDEFGAKLTEIDDELIPELEELSKVWMETLQEETEINIYNIKLEWLPDEINPKDFNILETLFEEV